MPGNTYVARFFYSYMKLINKPKYIFFSALGFVLYVVFTLSLDKISIKLSMPDEPMRLKIVKYFILEGLACGFLAWALSFIILFFYEKWIDFSDLKKQSVYKMVLVFSLTQVLYSFLVWPLLDALYFYHMGNNIQFSFALKLTNVPYFTVIFLIWIFSVTSYKVFNYINLVKVNQLQLESNLRESQLNTLKGQINPHFMFNSLNNIRGLILEDATRARDMITRLSEMLRYSLTKNDVNTISIKEELQTVDNYIEISKIQFEERLTFSIAVSPEVLSICIPPMIIQMLVENAVKHGIGKIKEGGAINLTVQKANGELIIMVQNSGSLSYIEGTTRLGLENIKKRLSLIYGNKAGFTLQESNNFVEAKISIPVV